MKIHDGSDAICAGEPASMNHKAGHDPCFIESFIERLVEKEKTMPIIKRLKEFFDETIVSYEVYNHPLAYTAQEIAQRQHVSGNQMAKVVMLKVDGNLVMAVITGSQRVDLPTARESLGAQEVGLATEDEFIAKFPDCEIGSMPPFGNLFSLPVYVDPVVIKDESIYFNAGNHIQTIRIRSKDFERIVKPQVLRLVEDKKNAA
jgi:Ala-tRNA(Pro) deacylase